jgi:DNA-binding CsgD family transcriptional regulator
MQASPCGEPVGCEARPQSGIVIGSARGKAPPNAHDAAEVTAAAYGLTPGETRVLASLLAGRTLAHTAAALGVAPATAKSHLDSIFSKTGVSRQADLMRLATGLVSPTKG